MIVLMTQKHFINNIQDYVMSKDYIIVDGFRYGEVDAGPRNRMGISNEYANSIVMSGLAPPGAIDSCLDSIEEGAPFNQRMFDDMVDLYLADQSFEKSVLAIMDGMMYNTDIDRNIFIIISKKVYKYLGRAIMQRMAHLLGCRVDLIEDYGRGNVLQNVPLIVPQKIIKSNQHLLATQMSQDTIRRIKESTRELEKKFSETEVVSDRFYKSKYL